MWLCLIGDAGLPRQLCDSRFRMAPCAAETSYRQLQSGNLYPSGFVRSIWKGGVWLAVNLDDKKRIAQDLNERFSKAAVVIVTDYKGLDVAAINDLRRKLRQEEVEYQVAKNSLLVRAAEDTDVALIKEMFKGPNAVAMSYGDPVAPAKILSDFAKDNKVFEIKVGVMDGKVLDAGEIKSLAALPSREVLLATFVSTLNSLPTGLVRMLAEIPRQLLNVLQAVKDQKEAA
jgi:large subunit ribosomal protein L10